MTIRIKVDCDGRGCCASIDIEDNLDENIEMGGWHVQQSWIEAYHYCPICWPIVKKEIEEDE